ncbi:disease resistance protein RPM1-like [Solanum stenotomum]|uniref:disease resistance protein RPM1-like n=1 Tax=Solanum stenotomum TaxID=172797 RepID=UPI0020D19D23|nr:disease resistance protein RPM1-like [Solanum stenotomum]XP_049378616.1 disease resistance protein RPM1-like [Solanum stenotomum]
MGLFLFSLQKEMNIDTCEDQVEMADCAVVFLLDKLTNLLAEEAILLQGVKHEIQYIKDELERMIAFLGVADAFEEGDAEVKVWVRQVRDVANDIEDVLDESMLLSYDHHYRGSCCFIAKLVFSIRNIKFRHKLVIEIQAIKSRVDNIAMGHHRYRYKFYVPEQGSNSNHAYDAANDRRGDALLLEEAELVGIENPTQQLIGWLVEDDPRLKVVSVVGMGGSGKTTLVKKVYEDAAVKKNFNSLAWITVSKSFKVEEVLKDMIQQLYDEVKQPAPEGLNTMSSNRLKTIAKVFLQSRTYVLVFDDVWTIHAWEAIRHALPDINNGSRVILTTRLLDLASFCSIETNGYVYEVKPLSTEESWILFCQKAFHGYSCPSHLESISRNILKKCGGLPLAVVAVGGVLATKNRNNIREWGMLNHSLGPELDSNDKFESMRIILLLSFNDLPYYLKPCFLYLSIYPEDHLIERNTLIYRWITEGFVKQKERRTVEDVADSYLNELINRSLIHPVQYNDDGSMKLGRIHDLYRELILSKSRDDNFTATVDEHNKLWPEKTRRLSMHGMLGNLQVKRSVTKLRSLLTFGVADPQSLSCISQVLGSSRMLRVLDLRGAPLNMIPETVFQLFHLRYLSLRNTNVKVLPRSIGRLKQLEILDLKQTYVTELPVEILKLENLRHLLVYSHVSYSYLPYNCSPGFKAFRGIGALRALQKLVYIEATPGSGILREVGMLGELRRLCILKLRKEDGWTVCSSIQKLRKLESLNLKSVEEHEILDLSYLSSPPPLLQRLYLTGHIVKLPAWIQDLNSLVKIYFRWTHLTEDPLKYLQDLPNLVHLEFLVGYTGKELYFEQGKFQRLKLLNLDKLEGLSQVTIGEGAVPHLEKLVIQRCALLETVPTGIEYLLNLKVLEFFDMPDEFIMTLRPEKLGADAWKVSHIPEVFYTYWRDGCWMVHSLKEKENNQISDQSGAVTRTYGRRNSL